VTKKPARTWPTFVNARYDEYRRQAETAKERAKNAINEEDRAGWLRLAEGWLSLLETTKKRDSDHGEN
jgi:hypothetical protein